MRLHVRPATDADAPALRRLGCEAFAPPSPPPGTPPPAPPTSAPPGASVLCDRCTVVGKAVDLELESWYGGRRVPTSGVAGVAVAAEYRGRGATRPLLTHLLRRARARGAVISTLYPTAPAYYRGLGYEVIGSYVTREVPTWALTRAPARPGPTEEGAGGDAAAVRVRRAVESDWLRIVACYDAWAAGATGALTRIGRRFAACVADLAEDVTAVSVAESAADPGGPLLGYCRWQRAGGYGAEGTIEVRDLITLTTQAQAALLRVVGSHEPTARTTRFHAGSGNDLAWVLRDDAFRELGATPYMLAVLDVLGAIAARGFSTAVAGTAELAVRATLPGVAGAYALTWAGGRSMAERFEGQAATWISARGFAALYAGSLRCAALRRLGMLGGDPSGDDLLDAAFGAAGPVDIRDYF